MIRFLNSPAWRIRQGAGLVAALAVSIGLAESAGWAQADPQPRLIEVRKIWDAAPHNAFTDLIRHKDRWFCVFREGRGHVSPDGALRVITSEDGVAWESAARITSETGDLRDAKITQTPDGRLMLGGAAALHRQAGPRHQSLVWFSDDGHTWSEPHAVGDGNNWLWRVTWHNRRAYGFGYGTGDQRGQLRLYTSENGTEFKSLIDQVSGLDTYPNETSLLFLPDDTALCLLRQDGRSKVGLVGRAKPPYTQWTWKSLDTRIGGPHWIHLPEFKRLVAVVRLYDGGARTSVCWIDAQTGTLTEALRLPSGGDTSYAGLVWHDQRLWISYYSSHEGKTSIYLAEVGFEAAEDPPQADNPRGQATPQNGSTD